MSDQPVTVEVWLAPRDWSRCKGCKQRIIWRRTVKGDKPLCFDDDRDVVRRYQDDASNGRIVEVVNAAGVHWRTCPAAEQFRRKLAAAQQQGRLEL